MRGSLNVLVLLPLLFSLPAAGDEFTDNFAGTSLSPVWSVTRQDDPGLTASVANGQLLMTKSAGIPLGFLALEPQFTLSGDFSSTVDVTRISPHFGMSEGLGFTPAVGGGSDVYLTGDNLAWANISTPQFTSNTASETAATATLKIDRVGSTLTLSYKTGLGGYTTLLSRTDPSLAQAGHLSLFLGEEHGDASRASAAFRSFFVQSAAPLLTKLPLAVTTQSPSSSLTTKYVPSLDNLKVFDPATNTFRPGLINTSAPTVVLTHGFNADPTNTWITNGFALSLHNAEPGINILAWDWTSDANHGTFAPNLPYAASRTANEGTALGNALIASLGTQYGSQVHFIGHSLGTLVNSKAIDVLHSQDTFVTIQDTLFDEASIANQFISPSQSPTYEVSPIPNTGAARIDNYISAFGTIHTEASNVILQNDPNAILPKTDPHYWTDHFHQYPVEWYLGTIRAPSLSPSGFAGAIERGNANLSDPSFQADSYNLQTATGNHYWELSPISRNTAISTLLNRNTDIINSVSSHLNSVIVGSKFLGLSADELIGAVAYQNQVSALLVETSTSGNTILTPQIILGKESSAQPLPANAHASILSSADTTVATSSSYAWLSLAVPVDAQYISMDFTFLNLSQNDFLTIGVNDTPLLQIESQFIPNGVSENSGLLDISQWSGQNVQLFLGLNAMDDNNIGGSITVGNIEFGTVPEPEFSLPMMLTGIFVVYSQRSLGRRLCRSY